MKDPDHLGSSSYISDANGEVVQHVEYFPFGETFLEEHSNTDRTPYLFNGKELDEETQLYYYGARYYDPRTSVWQSVDPIFDNYLDGGGNTGGVFNSKNLGVYSYTHNNPILYIDPDGRDVVVPNKKDRTAVLKMINSKALGLYAFDKSGKLYQVRSTGDASRYSKYYANKLVAAINDPQTIEIRIKNKIKMPSIVSNGKGGNKLKPEGGSTSVNVDAGSGGGVTYSISGGGGDNVLVYISGNEYKGLKDQSGNPLEDKPVDILAHELVGHAIPYTVGTDTGNAVDNENKVRKEVKKKGQTGASPLRKKDPSHKE